MEVLKYVRIVLKLTIILAVLLTVGMPQQAKAADSLNILADAAILVDADSGKILYAQNADATLGIASMTKMMTEYLLFEAIEDGRVSWDQEYTVTDYAYEISQDMRLSNVPLRKGEAYTIQELYEAMAIYSANAATIGIAETIAGTEEEFVRLMNEKAEELGLAGAKLVNSTGLSNSLLMGMHPKSTGANDENVMSAKAVAKLTKALLDDYPEVLETTKIPNKMFRPGTADAINMLNWNSMLPGLAFEYEGVDGLKTGSTDFAGHSFAGTAKRDGTRLIAVVMKAVDEKGVGSYKARFDQTRVLFDFGFGQFTKEEVIPGGYQIKGQETLPVTKGEEKAVSIAVKEPITMMIQTSDKEKYQPELVLDESVVADGKIEAGIGKGEVVGTVNIVKTEGEDYGYLDGSKSDAEVVTTEKVARANWFSLSVQAVGNFVSSMWSGALDFVKGLF